MGSSLFHSLLGVGLLALYLYTPVAQGYRRWAFLLLLVLFPLLAGSPVRDVRLAVHGVSTTGTVLAVRCTGGKYPQLLLTYQFKADGVNMTGTGQAGQGNGGDGGKCDMRAEDAVYLSYLPKEPVVNVPDRHPGLALLFKLLGWLAICLFLTWLKTEQAERVREHFNTMTFRRP
jgi:hypothetical protein